MSQQRNSSSAPTSRFSNLSLDSIENEETQPWHGLIHKLSDVHLGALHAIFMKKKSESGKNKLRSEGLSKDEFVAAIEEVLGNCKYSLQSTITFDDISNGTSSTITWNEFLDFIIENFSAKRDSRIHLEVGDIVNPPHAQRDTISKIVLIETVKYFCYVIISKYGHVGLYDGNMNFLTSYHTIMSREDITRKDEERRRRNRWITDAVFLEDVLMFVVTTSVRNITIYDASNLNHVILWIILGVPNIIECFCYYTETDAKEATLFMGHDNGEISSLIFVQPKQGLLRKKHNDKLSLFYWTELIHEKEFIAIKNYGKFHNGNVGGIQFNALNSTIASCSRDINASVVIRNLKHSTEDYVFKIKKGATCFSISFTLKIMITGTVDGTVDIWNIWVTSKPVTSLSAHQTAIIDVEILEWCNMFITFSKNSVLKLWDFNGQNYMQSIKLKFPPLYVLGKTIEWGPNNSVYPGPKRQTMEENNFIIKTKWERSHFYISCCNFVATIKVMFADMNWVEIDLPVLPPPPLQNSVLLPTNWKIIGDSYCDELQREQTAPKATDLDQTDTIAYMDDLKFILDKDIVTDLGCRSDINYLVANIETKKLQMKGMVKKCAPYLALDLHEIEEIQLPQDLPTPVCKRTKKLMETTSHMLSAANNRSQIFLTPSSSSSRTRSSRSSLITFE